MAPVVCLFINHSLTPHTTTPQQLPLQPPHTMATQPPQETACSCSVDCPNGSKPAYSFPSPPCGVLLPPCLRLSHLPFRCSSPPCLRLLPLTLRRLSMTADPASSGGALSTALLRAALAPAPLSAAQVRDSKSAARPSFSTASCCSSCMGKQGRTEGGRNRQAARQSVNQLPQPSQLGQLLVTLRWERSRGGEGRSRQAVSKSAK